MYFYSKLLSLKKYVISISIQSKEFFFDFISRVKLETRTCLAAETVCYTPTFLCIKRGLEEKIKED